MDPDATLELMLTAYHESNWNEATEHAEAILVWLRGGGFAPKLTVGIERNNLLFDFDHEWLNRTVADALVRVVMNKSRHNSI